MTERDLEGPSSASGVLRLLLEIHLFVSPQLAFGDEQEKRREERMGKKEKEKEREKIARVDCMIEPLLSMQFLINAL